MQSDAAGKERRFDIIVWGASGFTGRLVVEYLAQRCGPDASLQWAVAGRDRDKLENVLSRYVDAAAKPEILLADSHDRASLDKLARDARVIISTVGPYAKYGSALVAACVEQGTHYCDLAGESQWIRQMIDQHDAAARQSGACIVNCCGFDSIPSDIGVAFLQREAASQFGAPCESVTLIVRAIRGGASGGTYASMLNAVVSAREDRNIARILADPYALNPDGERQGPDGRDQSGVRFHPDARAWTAPFVMAAINTRIVRRTNALLDYPYGRDFRYSEVTFTGSGAGGWLRAAIMTAGLGAFMFFASFEWSRNSIVRWMIPAPGEGPNRKQREQGFFNLQLLGKTAGGDVIRARVTGDRDPGYGSTSKMLAESAICLARENSNALGGFRTPVAAMGRHLEQQLIEFAGLTFTLETND